jgi:hypothetical protein
MRRGHPLTNILGRGIRPVFQEYAGPKALRDQVWHAAKVVGSNNRTVHVLWDEAEVEGFDQLPNLSIPARPERPQSKERRNSRESRSTSSFQRAEPTTVRRWRRRNMPHHPIRSVGLNKVLRQSSQGNRPMQCCDPGPAPLLTQVRPPCPPRASPPHIVDCRPTAIASRWHPPPSMCSMLSRTFLFTFPQTFC